MLAGSGFTPQVAELPAHFKYAPHIAGSALPAVGGKGASSDDWQTN